MVQRILALLVFAGLVAPGWEATPSRQYAYVFDSRARFIKIDSQAARIVDVGNLWWLGTFGLTKPRSNPAKDGFLTFALVAPATKEQDLQREVIVFEPDSNGDLRKDATIDIRARPIPDARGAELTDLSGLMYQPDGSRIYLSWNESGGSRTAILDATSYKELAQVPQNWATDRTCFSADGAKIYVPFAEEFLVANVPDNKVVERLAVKDMVGTRAFFSKSVVAAASTATGCKAAILEYQASPGTDKSDGTLYIYNLDARKQERKIEANWYGDVLILQDGRTILADLKVLVPNKLPDGRTVGSRIRRIGRLRVYDLGQPEKFNTITVPEEGTGLWVGHGGDLCIYTSAQALAIVDLKAHSVAKTIDNPLSNVQAVVFLNR